MIERAAVGASEAQSIEGWPAPAASENASSEIFGAMLAAFTALDASVTPVVEGTVSDGIDASEGEGDGSNAAELQPVTLASAPALSAILTLDIPLQQNPPTKAGEGPEPTADQTTQQSAVPAQPFVAAGELEFSAPTTSWSSASLDVPIEQDAHAAADWDDTSNAASLRARPALDWDLHAPVHEMDSEGGGLDSVVVDLTEMDPEFAPVENSPSVRHEAAPETRLPDENRLADETRLLNETRPLNAGSIEIEKLAVADDAPSVLPVSNGEPTDADKKTRGSRGSEPAAAPAHRVTAAALAARDLAAPALAPLVAQDAPTATLVTLPDAVSPTPLAQMHLEAPWPIASGPSSESAIHTSAEPRAAAALSWTPEIHHELAAKAREFFHRGETEMRFTLDPPEMGKLRIHLEISEHRLCATITATNAATAALLERDRSDLVRAFQSQGIDDVSVQVGAERDPAHEHPDSRSPAEREAHFETPYTDPVLRRPRSSRSVVDCFV